MKKNLNCKGSDDQKIKQLKAESVEFIRGYNIWGVKALHELFEQGYYDQSYVSGSLEAGLVNYIDLYLREWCFEINWLLLSIVLLVCPFSCFKNFKQYKKSKFGLLIEAKKALETIERKEKVIKFKNIVFEFDE